ncbi:MAG: hypothetical protein HY791_28715 [Deltaproteobacteria bacterium]|nr:hypothetical protein [Deltaproteobacteria bacterium]
MSRRSGSLFAVLPLIVAAPSWGAEFTLAWDPNPEPEVTGYKLYYDGDGAEPFDGVFFNEGPSPIDIPVAGLSDPTQPSFRLTGVGSCVHVYFALTAYNSAGLESAFSNFVDATALARPSTVAVAAVEAGLALSWDSALPEDRTVETIRVEYDFDSGDPYAGSGASEGDSPITTDFGVVDASSPTFALTSLPSLPVYVRVVYGCLDGTAKASPEAVGTPLLASSPDSGVDAGPPDLGIDSGFVADGGLTDAEDLDGSTAPDARADAAVPADATTAPADATAADATAADATAPADAVSVDGRIQEADSGGGPDARAELGVSPVAATIGGGCGCNGSSAKSSPRSSPRIGLFLLLLAGLGRVRRVPRR